MAKNFHVTIRMDERFWDNVKAKAVAQGTNASAVVHTLLEAWLDGRTYAQAQTDSDTSVQSVQPSVRDEMESLRQQIQALTAKVEEMGKPKVGDRPDHHTTTERLTRSQGNRP